MRVAPAFRKRFGDFQPDHGTAVSLLFKWGNVIAKLRATDRRYLQRHTSFLKPLRKI
jgi:hypothetical protein